MLSGLWHLMKEVVVEPLYKSRIAVVLISSTAALPLMVYCSVIMFYERSKSMQELKKNVQLMSSTMYCKLRYIRETIQKLPTCITSAGADMRSDRCWSQIFIFRQ